MRTALDGLVAVPTGNAGDFHGTTPHRLRSRSSMDRLLEETDLSAGIAGRSKGSSAGLRLAYEARRPQAREVDLGHFAHDAIVARQS